MKDDRDCLAKQAKGLLRGECSPFRSQNAAWCQRRRSLRHDAVESARSPQRPPCHSAGYSAPSAALQRGSRWLHALVPRRLKTKEIKSRHSTSWLERLLRLVVVMTVAAAAACGGRCHLVSAQLVHESQMPALHSIAAAWPSVTTATWQDGSECSKWNSVTCNNEGLVSTIDLSNQGLEGPLPTALFTLTTLQQLRLNDNSLDGSLLAGIGNLTQLTLLSLGRNEFSGPIPPSLSNLQALKYLLVSDNELSETIPAEIGSITTLQALDLSMNRLSGVLPSPLLQLPNLVYFDISNNEFSGPLPSVFSSPSLASLPLATFNVEKNFFTGSARAEVTAGNIAFCPEDQQGGFAAANLLPYSPSQYGSVRGNCLNPRGGGGCEEGGRQRKQGECLAFCGVNSAEGVCGGYGRCFLKGPSRVPVCVCEEGYYEDMVEWNGGSYPTCSANKPENPPPPFPPDPPPDEDDPLKQRHRPGLRDRDFKSVRAMTPSHFNRFFRYGSLGFNGSAAQPSWAYRQAVDWRGRVLVRGRNVTVVPAVKDQGLCAACWALVPIAAIEAAYAISFGANHPNLSSQQVLSCQGTWQCTGGIPADAFQFVAAVGGVSVEKAVPYTGVVNASDCKLLPTKSKPAAAAKRTSPQSKPQPAPPKRTTKPPTKPPSGPLTGPASRPLKQQNKKAAALPVKKATSASKPAKAVKGMVGGAGPQKLARPTKAGQAKPPKKQTTEGRPLSKPAAAAAARGRQALARAAPERAVSTSAATSAGRAAASSAAVTSDEDDKRKKPSPSFPSIVFQLLKKIRGPTQPPKLPPTPAPPSSPSPTPAFPPQVPSIRPLSGRFSISMFEQVSVPGWLGMVLALQAQPIIANVEADQLSFINYQGGFVYADPDCFLNGVVNHIVLLVGYSLEGVTPYFLLQNTWGSTWGDGGFMQMAIESGSGICGINTSPALYPVVGGSHPCQPINPCGSGKCSNRGGKSKCACAAGFAAARNIDGSETCTAVHVCAMTAANPCQVGTCLDDGAGGYNCLCPAGFVADERPDETPVCVPGVTPSEVHVVPGLTCDIVRSTFGISEANFTQLNPKLNCSSLAIGDDINVSDGTLCATPYTVTADDTCESIAAAFSMTRSQFLQLNDDLPCGRLQAGQQVCVAHGTPDMPACQEFQTVAEGDSCDTMMRAARPPLSAQEFYSLNPGINCNAGEQMLLGQQVCVRGGKSSVLLGASRCLTKSVYTVVTGDTCARILAMYFKSSARLLAQYNSGYVCTNSRLYKGVTLCKAP
ncbi:hypothetical protein CLOM_g7740 [Closterium sp. NIES-68]|nr:hypothetical protein CLOM_g7740 [Closterium sp. NIES-68]GJP63007.1 hypothetical protein CLOP_g20060 [Closterium sp. NIES-67]